MEIFKIKENPEAGANQALLQYGISVKNQPC